MIILLKCFKMSVKHQRNSKLNWSVRDLRENTTGSDNFSCYQYVNCIGNKIQFHKKLLGSFSLHLLCVSSRSICKSFSSDLPQSPSQEIEYFFQVEDMNLHVSKCLVKHTFSLQKYMGDKADYLRIEFPEQQRISIQSCSISSTKTGMKVIQVSDVHRIKNCADVTVINPVQLIQQNMKLRAIKLTKSATKNIQFNSQSVKKLNLIWNKQPSKEQREDSPSFTNWRPKRQADNSSFCNSVSNCQIKGVPLKKSVEKCEPLKSRSVSKAEKDLSLRNIKSTNILQRSTQRQNNMAVSRSNKNLNGGCAKNNEKGSRTMKQNSEGEDISSQSYYTAKKKLENSFQVQLESKKSSQTASKQNIVHTNCSFGSKAYPKLAYTEYRNHRQSEVNISASSNMDPKKFRKNISQIKIAQISRTLLPTKTKN